MSPFQIHPLITTAKHHAVSPFFSGNEFFQSIFRHSINYLSTASMPKEVILGIIQFLILIATVTGLSLFPDATATIPSATQL